MMAAKRNTPPGLLFLRQFLGQPRMIGSIVPTSRATIQALLAPIDWHSCRCIVEYGPGTGVFTRELLRRSGRQTRVIAIDASPTFTDYLRGTIRDPRLICVHGSAENVEQIVADQGFDGADHVVSGLPFSTLPRPITLDIMDATMRVVRPNGAFLVYQYSSQVLPMLETRFDRVERGTSWLCVPPARLFWAWRDAEPKMLSRAVGGESSAAA